MIADVAYAFLVLVELLGLAAVLLAARRVFRWATAPLPHPSPLLELWQESRLRRGEYPEGAPRCLTNSAQSARARRRRKSRKGR